MPSDTSAGWILEAKAVGEAGAISVTGGKILLVLSVGLVCISARTVKVETC